MVWPTGTSMESNNSQNPPARPDYAPRHPGTVVPPPVPPQEHAVDGLLHIVGRQWHLIALCTVLGLLMGAAYLVVAKKVYTGVATIQVVPVDSQDVNVTNNPGGNNNLEPTADFLETQCAVISRQAVLALAVEKVKDTKTLKNEPHPLQYLKSHVTAELSKKGQLIDVSFDAPDRADAVAITAAIVDGYKTYETNLFSSRAMGLIENLKHSSVEQAEEIKKRQRELVDIATQAGGPIDTDPSHNPAHMRVANLQEFKQKADIEVLTAHQAYEQAARRIIGNPELVRRVEEQSSHSPTVNPADGLKLAQTQLLHEEAKLSDDSRVYLPNHPIIKSDQSRVDQMVVLTVVAAKDWEDAATANQAAIEKELNEAQKAELDQRGRQLRYMEISAEIDRMQKLSSSFNDKAGETNFYKSAGGLNIAVPDPAYALDDTKPAKGKTMSIALVVGLVIGLGAACLRDWSDDRLRSNQSVKDIVGAPVLGTIPAISTAHSTADRGQIVHHDPFGEAAESFRTLRTAVQFGLPPRTKTVLITSPVPGDGKSTVVSNLGIALAQAGRHVLIVDADFRAPTQHRLFGLRDRVGFATVLAGTDRIDRAVQRTEIESLDILPCGPVPSNPSEMLNDPSFFDHLNDLADKYDVVLIDSPPVTSVADARILAASADVTVLVVRPEASTRKLVEAARDGLRSVGARLLGVAINGVGRRSGFTGASGYYSRPDGPTPRAPQEDPVRS